MVKLVDTPDLGSGAARCESSSLSSRTIKMSSSREDKSKKFIGVSPSGKAPGFDLGIPRFESLYPSHGNVAQLVRAQHS